MPPILSAHAVGLVRSSSSGSAQPVLSEVELNVTVWPTPDLPALRGRVGHIGGGQVAEPTPDQGSTSGAPSALHSGAAARRSTL